MKNLVFVIFIAFSILLLSCEGDIYLEYRWTGMSVNNAENSTFYPEISVSDSIDASIYVIQVSLGTEKISEEGRYYDTETPPILRNGVDSISIVSNQDFNLDFPAGSNLAPMFDVLIGNYFKTFPADKSDGWRFTKVYSDDFEDSPMVEEVNLLLNAEPQDSLEHVFTVEWILSDESVFVDETNPIVLK